TCALPIRGWFSSSPSELLHYLTLPAFAEELFDPPPDDLLHRAILRPDLKLIPRWLDPRSKHNRSGNVPERTTWNFVFPILSHLPLSFHSCTPSFSSRTRNTNS